jgi:hypothetical protein
MAVDKFNDLIITRSTVESISQQEIGQMMVGFSWRADVWRKPHKFLQMCSIQIIGAGIILMAMMLPVDRVLSIYRSPPSQSERLTRLILVDGAMTTIVLSGINRSIFLRGKRLQRLLKLVAQIEQYNQIVRSIDTLEKVAALTSQHCEPAQIANMMEILAQTRQNLLTALEIDRYLRHYPNSSELTISIARNLIDLQNLAQQPQLAEYGTLLTQAWEIGMSVYEERAGLYERT